MPGTFKEHYSLAKLYFDFAANNLKSGLKNASLPEEKQIQDKMLIANYYFEMATYFYNLCLNTLSQITLTITMNEKNAIEKLRASTQSDLKLCLPTQNNTSRKRKETATTALPSEFKDSTHMALSALDDRPLKKQKLAAKTTSTFTPISSDIHSVDQDEKNQKQQAHNQKGLLLSLIKNSYDQALGTDDPAQAYPHLMHCEHFILSYDIASMHISDQFFCAGVLFDITQAHYHHAIANQSVSELHAACESFELFSGISEKNKFSLTDLLISEAEFSLVKAQITEAKKQLSALSSHPTEEAELDFEFDAPASAFLVPILPSLPDAVDLGLSELDLEQADQALLQPTSELNTQRPGSPKFFSSINTSEAIVSSHDPMLEIDNQSGRLTPTNPTSFLGY